MSGHGNSEETMAEKFYRLIPGDPEQRARFIAAFNGEIPECDLRRSLGRNAGPDLRPAPYFFGGVHEALPRRSPLSENPQG